MSEAVADLPALKFNDDPQQLAVAAIYATILQSTDECLLLLNRSSVTSVGSIIRSMLESFADLCGVIAEPTYVERMLATFEDQKLRPLKNMSRSRSDEFYKDLAGQLDVEAMKSQVSTALSEYRSRGHQPLSNAERFREADLIYIYESLYWHLCLSGHNDISSLERRHIRVSDGSVELIMLRENDLQEAGLGTTLDLGANPRTASDRRASGVLDESDLRTYRTLLAQSDDLSNGGPEIEHLAQTK